MSKCVCIPSQIAGQNTADFHLGISKTPLALQIGKWCIVLQSKLKGGTIQLFSCDQSNAKVILTGIFWCDFRFKGQSSSGTGGKKIVIFYTTPRKWLLAFSVEVLYNLAKLSRSAIVMYSKFLEAFLCCHVAFWIFFCGCKSFCNIVLSQTAHSKREVLTYIYV